MRRAQVVAHRGSSGSAAEHTLAAYELAVEEGADALECDVRLTRDGVLVCVHDRTVNRTSNGRGVVSTLELRELAELDFASWRRAELDKQLAEEGEEVDTDRDRHSVLTLERLVQLAKEVPARSGAPLQLHVETKHPTRYGGLVEQRLVELLGRYGLARPLSRSSSQITVMSYAGASLRRLHAMAPVIPTVFLLDRVPVRYRNGSLPPQVSGAGPALGVLKAHPGYVERLHARGHRVHCHTADDPADIAFLLDLGVDYVISNHPSRVWRELERLPR